MDELTNLEIIKLVDIVAALKRTLQQKGIEMDSEAIQKLAVTIYLQSSKLAYFAKQGNG